MHPSTQAFGFGGGTVVLDEHDGSVVGVRHPGNGRDFLLREDPASPDASFHDSTRRWGKGFVITERGSHRFDQPRAMSWREDGVDLDHRMGDLRLRVRRSVDQQAWSESYVLRNEGPEPAALGTLAISTPWRDVYHSSADSLSGAVHAHVWTGGSDSWVWAEPMDGSAPGLGLAVTAGQLWSYSVESRDQLTSSNIRGHLYLQVTDHARSPSAMGGQPVLTLGPGEELRLTWELRWYDGLAEFRASREPLLSPAALICTVGRPISVATSAGAEMTSESLTTRPDGSGVSVTSDRPGVHHLRARVGERSSRISLAFHRPLRDIVERRIRFILDHQRSPELAGSWSAAFLPFDRRTGLTVLPGAWRDWSNGRERVAMALLLQAARGRGWGSDEELDAALDAYAAFLREHVVEPDGTVRDDSRRPGPVRLYNFPWFAQFFQNAYDLYGRRADLDEAVSIMVRYYALGGEHFLAFRVGPILRELSDRLSAVGEAESATRLTRQLGAHAATFVGLGEDLPGHEVNYEQSMVAPLLDLLVNAYALAPATVPADELARRLRWLLAFGGDQPDARLQHVPIRHWDGYWFGALRSWGDVFPHYWSVLSADVFLSWPAAVPAPIGIEALRERGRRILRSNLSAYDDDGFATCAFVYPSCVNGNPAHLADPLANDQDWSLVYALWHEAELGS